MHSAVSDPDSPRLAVRLDLARAMPSQRYNQTPPSFRQRSRRRMMREQDSSPRARSFARPVVRQTKPRRVASVRRTQDIAEDSSPLPLPLARASETRNSSTVSQKYRRESGRFCPVTTVALLILLGNADHQHSESRAEIRLHAPLVSRSPDARIRLRTANPLPAFTIPFPNQLRIVRECFRRCQFCRILLCQ